MEKGTWFQYFQNSHSKETPEVKKGLTRIPTEFEQLLNLDLKNCKSLISGIYKTLIYKEEKYPYLKKWRKDCATNLMDSQQEFKNSFNESNIKILFKALVRWYHINCNNSPFCWKQCGAVRSFIHCWCHCPKVRTILGKIILYSKKILDYTISMHPDVILLNL